jgi:hypothetical protein
LVLVAVNCIRQTVNVVKVTEQEVISTDESITWPLDGVGGTPQLVVRASNDIGSVLRGWVGWAVGQNAFPLWFLC